MLTIDAVKDAIVESLRDESMTEGELQRYLRQEMHPNISNRDTTYALGQLLKSGKVTEIVSRDPHGGHDGMPSLYSLK